MESRNHFKNGANPKNNMNRNLIKGNFMLKKIPGILLATALTASRAHAQFAPHRGYGSRSPSMGGISEMLVPIAGVIVAIVIIGFIIRKVSGMKSNLLRATTGTGNTFVPPPNMGMRGKTAEQKKVIRYFGSIRMLDWIVGCLTCGLWLIYVFFIRKMSSSAFDELLDGKRREIASRMATRSLEAHGMDAEEANEIPPILAGDYHWGSPYRKVFMDQTFRASGYQMTYLMFSGKQMYAYNYIFDLTSKDTTETTKEYFYEDITNVEVTKKQQEFPKPRSWGYIFGCIGAILAGILLVLLPGLVANWATDGRMVLIVYSKLFGLGCALGFILSIVGIVALIGFGYSRRVVESLILRLTVANDEFVCPMQLENVQAVQGMKAKIREKKG